MGGVGIECATDEVLSLQSKQEMDEVPLLQFTRHVDGPSPLIDKIPNASGAEANTHGNYTSAGRASDLKTCDGNAGPNAVCVFPFTYKGVEYTECTAEDYEEAWCYTNSTDPDGRQAWGACRCHYTCRGTAGGARCKLPFEYGGITRNACINEGYPEPWCPTHKSILGVRLWGICECTGNETAGCFIDGLCDTLNLKVECDVLAVCRFSTTVVVVIVAFVVVVCVAAVVVALMIRAGHFPD